MVLPAGSGPLDLSTYDAEINLNHPWLQRVVASTGKIYYTNVETKQSTWEMPDTWLDEVPEDTAVGVFICGVMRCNVCNT